MFSALIVLLVVFAVIGLITDSPSGNGHLLWHDGGGVFLHIGENGDAALIGILQPPSVWDVRSILDGASDFTWAGVAP